MPRYSFSTVIDGGLGADPADFAAANIAAFPALSGFTPGVNTLNPPPEQQPGPGDGGVSQAGDVPLATFTVQPGTDFGLHSSVHVVQQTGASSNRVDIIFMYVVANCDEV